MKIVLISCVFPPEPVVSSKTSFQLANALSDRGHEVIVICPFPSRPSGKAYDGFTRKFYKKDKVNDNLSIIRCFSIFSRSSSFYSRFIENISFGFFSFIMFLLLRRVDVVYTNTWPIFASSLILFASKVKRTPIISFVQDLYPETLVYQNRVKENSILVTILRRIDKFLSLKTDHLIVISKNFEQRFRKLGIREEKISFIENWSDDRFNKRVLDFNFKKKINVPDGCFLSVYAGNISYTSGVGMLIQAFAEIEKRSPNTYLCIAGEGSFLSSAQNMARNLSCERIRFFSPWPEEETFAVLESADLLLLPTIGLSSLSSMPSKLINYMVSGRPILAQAIESSDLAQTIHLSQCGWVIPPDDMDMLIDEWIKITTYESDLLHRHGLKGEQYATAKCGSHANLPQLVNIIENLEPSAV
jgi:colanic acid biosynthesis glycosyl transferase WcaI